MERLEIVKAICEHNAAPHLGAKHRIAPVFDGDNPVPYCWTVDSKRVEEITEMVAVLDKNGRPTRERREAVVGYVVHFDELSKHYKPREAVDAFLAAERG